MRRLPIYILLDTSSAMDGEPLEKVKNGVETIISTLNTDPYALETAYISVITFGGSAIQAVPLTELEHFQLPQIKAEGNKLFDEALLLLSEKIDSEIVKTTSNSKGDWYPIIFIMTDGVISSNFDKGLEALRLCKLKTVVVCTIEKNVEMDILKNISENIISLENIDELRLRSFMKWIDQPIVERRFEEEIALMSQNSASNHRQRKNEYQTRSRDNNTETKRKMFIAPFSFKGRIESGEYLCSFVLVAIVNIGGILTKNVLSNCIVDILIIMIQFLGLYFLIAQGTKRCHDFGRSGLWQIIPFCYGLFCTIGGNKCRNQYGLPPTTKKDLLRFVDNIEDIVNDCSFKGRCDRGEYLMSLFLRVFEYVIVFELSILFNLIAMLIFFLPLLTNFDLLCDKNLNGLVLDILIFSHLIISVFFILWIFFANGTKRCHDLGKSGWWQFIPLYFFVMMFKKGENGTNKYGVEP